MRKTSSLARDLILEPFGTVSRQPGKQAVADQVIEGGRVAIMARPIVSQGIDHRLDGDLSGVEYGGNTGAARRLQPAHRQNRRDFQGSHRFVDVPFHPPVTDSSILPSPPVRVNYGSPVTGSGIVPRPPDRVNNDSELPLLALDAG